MGYKKKSTITLDTDSALVLMQEIYNDIVEQKNIASQITKKMVNFMKEPEDMTMIGSVIDKQQKILQDCTEKKISLVKLQAALLKQSGGGGGNDGKKDFGKMELTTEDRKVIQHLLEETNEPEEGKNNTTEGEKYSTE